jgi:exonuclease VII large subunit
VEQIGLEFDFGPPPRRVYSVGELNRAIAALLGAEFADVWVGG